MSTRVYEEQQKSRPPQQQERQPGREGAMSPQPVYIRDGYKGSDKLRGRSALITGGDSGIGRAAAVHFAREGADVAIAYLEEHEDARRTKTLVQAEGTRCILLPGDVGEPSFCRRAVEETLKAFGRLDVLVNNAAEQHPKGSLEEISPEQLEKTFRTNFFGYLFMTQAAMKPLEEKKGRIINMASVTAYEGNPQLIDYSATKGAIVSFTRALARSAAPRGVRVNSVSPGPIWTPLIPSTFPAEKVETFGKETLMGRAGQPAEVGTCCVFLACEDSSYLTGQSLHPDGGRFVSG
jgi:NAD(P)-dependent dehydrogenase (short-subunit alcohol dehydrogenase family)